MQSQQFIEGTGYVTLSFLPIIIASIRAAISKLQDISTGAADPSDLIKDSDISLTENQRGELGQVVEAMQNQFQERWGSGKDDTVFAEHTTRGRRRIRKGIPEAAFMCAVADWRTKNLKMLSETDRDKVYSKYLEKMISVARGSIQPDTRSQASDDGRSSAVENEPRGSSSSAAMASKEFDPLSMLQDMDDNISEASDCLESQLKAELEQYCKLPQMKPCSDPRDPQGDPLHRWRECQHAFPHVSRVARRYLAVPGSSAASERAFSSAGLVITKKRTSLRPDNAEALFLLKHHWDSQGMFRETQKRLTQRQHQEEGVDDPYDEQFQQDQPQHDQFSDDYNSDNNVAGGEEDDEEGEAV